MYNLTFIFSNFDSEYDFKKLQLKLDQDYPGLLRINYLTTSALDNDLDKRKDYFKILDESDFIFIGTHGGVTYFESFPELMERYIDKKPFYLHSGMDDESEEVFEESLLSMEQFKKLYRYYSIGGRENHENLLKYILNEFAGVELSYEEAKYPVWDGIYSPEGRVEDIDKYLDNLISRSKDKPVIGLLFHNSMILRDDLESIDYMIERIEEKGNLVLPVHTYVQNDPERNMDGIYWVVENLFKKDGEVVVDAIINTSPYSLTILGQAGDGSENLLDKSVFEDLGVPVIQAMKTYGDYNYWKESIEGIDSMALTSQVCYPEFDGQLISSLGFYTEIREDEIGKKLVTRPIVERLDKIIDLAANWGKLRIIDNQDKKIAIIFHNMPPRNDMIGCAYGLDSPQTVFNIVKVLKEDGISLDYDFKDGDEIISQIIDAVSNDSRWLTADKVREKSVDLISKELYKSWFEGLAESTRQELVRDWDSPPGDFMVYGDEMPVPGIVNGNIFIGLQPSRGYDEKAEEAYHSTKLVPPHQYIAYYKWIKHIFQADLIMHIGTHGTLEWLPGKQLGLSDECYPDICIQDLPHIYPYIINVPGEGIQAKRRSYAGIIDHLIPSMMKSGSYDYLEELEILLKQYYHSKQGDSGKLGIIVDQIIDLSIENKLNLDLKLEEEDIRKNPEEFIDELHIWIDGIKSSLVKDGLHIFGEMPEDERLNNMIVALLNLENGDIPSLIDGVASARGYKFEELLENKGEVDEKARTNLMILDELDDLARKLIDDFSKYNFSKDFIDMERISRDYSLDGDLDKLEKVLNFVSESIIKKLQATEDELINLLGAVNGRFIPPGGSGAPTRGNVEILPTGRNFYSIDPTSIPNKSSYKVGMQLADDLIERYLRDEGRIPENIAIVVYSGETMKTYGDDIGEILYLMGVRPKWLASTDKVIGLEVIPLEELGRPRIDVTLRISGLFRDTFPNVVELVERAVNLVASLDESPEDNYIIKNMNEEMEELLKEGFTKEDAKKYSLIRIFACPPGSYGAGVDKLINSKEWDDYTDLGDVYTLWGGHAYGKELKGEKVRSIFKRRLSKVDLTVKNESSMEIDMLESDDFYNYHGGLISAVRTASGRKPRSYSGDSSDPKRTQLRDISEESSRIMRARILNPKWIEGLKRHGYKGAQEISAMMDIVFGWDATSEVIEDWMYDEIVESFVKNKENREWIEDVNPWAMNNIVERLLEAYQRDMWEADEDKIDELRKIYVETEGNIEEYI